MTVVQLPHAVAGLLLSFSKEFSGGIFSRFCFVMFESSLEKMPQH